MKSPTPPPLPAIPPPVPWPRLNKEPIIEYLKSNVVLLRWMIEQGCGAPAPSHTRGP